MIGHRFKSTPTNRFIAPSYTSNSKTVVKVSRGLASAPLNLASYDPGSCFGAPAVIFRIPAAVY